MSQTGVTDDSMIGPIDYLVVEFADGRPTGAALPHLVDLVDRGVIRILDIALLTADGSSYTSIRPGDLVAAGVTEFALFEGAATGLLGDDDLSEIAGIMQDGAAAVVLLYENAWAAPLATAMRRSGGEMIASGRIPVQAVLDALATD